MCVRSFCSFRLSIFFFFFFNDTATTEIYTLSLHDALPISRRLPRLLPGHRPPGPRALRAPRGGDVARRPARRPRPRRRSEEHTSELQSQSNLVCRLLLEKKKKKFSETNSLTGDDISGCLAL